jgi:beta-aspartyl-peptidase (threonine type)
MPINRFAAAEPRKKSPFVLVIHGGAGVLSRKEMTPEKETAYREKLAEALRAGHAVLKADGTSVDAVVAAIKILEDSPLFNAGKGAALNHEGVAELDASLMDGATRKAGAVAAVKRIRNPIEAARLVMDKTPHVLLAGAGADEFAERQGLKRMPPEYFITEDRRQQLEEIQREEKSKKQAHTVIPPVADRVGTVGAVALDKHGNLAAGTSTGGLANKQPGRVGDSPIIGAGTYANNATCAVSGTGQGEFFIRAVAAYDIAALMEYQRASLADAANTVVLKKLVAMKAEGGVIAIDGQGNIAMPFNTEGMYRGSIRDDGRPNVMIYEK